MKSKIPPHLHALVVQKAAEGLTSEEIGAFLWAEHKVEVHASNVRRLLERDRSERADVAKSVVRTELRKHLLDVIGRIDRIVKRAAGIERRALERAAELRHGADGHPHHPLATVQDALALRAMDEQLRAMDRFLHYAGLSQPDAPGQTAAPLDRATLIKRLAAMIAANDNTPKQVVN